MGSDSSPTASISPGSSIAGSASLTTSEDESSRNGSQGSPSTATSETSTGLGSGQLTLWREDSPARERLSPEGGPGSGIPKLRYGERCSGSFARYDPATSSWKTSQLSLFGTRGSYSERFSGAWPRAGMTRSGTVFQLPPSAPPTAETASSSRLLPTPSSWLGRRPENASPDPEREASQRHPGKKGQRSVELPDVLAKLRLLPTPVANDDGKSPEAHLRMKARLPGAPRTQITSLGVLARAGFRQPGPSTGAPTATPSSAGSESSDVPRLNPCFVEWMMGAPDRWTDPDCPLSATAFSSRRPG
jgi:hypothetical protein